VAAAANATDFGSHGLVWRMPDPAILTAKLVAG